MGKEHLKHLFRISHLAFNCHVDVYVGNDYWEIVDRWIGVNGVHTLMTFSPNCTNL